MGVVAPGGGKNNNKSNTTLTLYTYNGLGRRSWTKKVN